MQVIRATSSPKRRWRAARPFQRARPGWTAGHRSPPAATGGGLEIDTTSFLSGVHVVLGRWIYVQRHRARRDPRRLCCRRQRRADPSFEPDGGEAGHEVCWARRDASCSGVVGLPARGGCLSLLMPDAWKTCSPC
jgi:hypothetical protein